ncbi:MAG: dephospho-CoA kinase [Clostridia bacterium]|nr:dephospho-CoA kinase [Clostridia bacterium]
MLANKPYVLGLTGGIACGKSQAAAYLVSLGAFHIDADAESKALTAENGAALPEIRSRFGDEVFHEDGTLDRKALGDVIFNDSNRRRELEGILHPLIQRRVMDRMAEAAANGVAVVMLDVPLLFETGMDAICDETWVLRAEYETQCERIMERGFTREQAEARIASQMSDEERCDRATRVISTERPAEKTCAELNGLYQQLLKKHATE